MRVRGDSEGIIVRQDESSELTKKLTQGIFVLYLVGSCGFGEEQPT